MKCKLGAIELADLTGFGASVQVAIKKLLSVLAEIDHSDSITIELDQKANFIRISLKDYTESRLPFQIDVFDNYYDIFIDDGIEFDLQLEIASVDKWIIHVRSLLESKVQAKYRYDSKGNRKSAGYSFYHSGKKLANTKYGGFLSSLTSDKSTTCEYQSWI